MPVALAAQRAELFFMILPDSVDRGFECIQHQIRYGIEGGLHFIARHLQLAHRFHADAVELSRQFQ